MPPWARFTSPITPSAFPSRCAAIRSCSTATANLLDRSGGPLFELADRFAALFAEEAGPAQWAVRRQEAFALKAALAEAARDPAVRAALDAAVAAQNGTLGLPESFQALHELLEDQAYRLAYWRVASSEINYRRFFDINQLAGLRMEQGEVFEATHRLLLRLIAEGKVQGVRLDHIDGLYDPRGYCQRLLARAADVLAEGEDGERPEIDARQGRPIYLVVEKILARHESLREDLPVAGTTGYEFMNLVNGLFVDPAAARSLTTTYHRFIDQELAFDQVVLAAKQQILRYYLNSELHVLGHEFYRLAQQSWLTRDFTLTGLREALADIITRFPVYRTYITEDGAKPEDRRDLDWAVSRARRETALVDHTVFDFLHAALSTDLVGTHGYQRAEVIATRHALPAADRAGHGEVGRGHRVLPLPSPGLAQRSGRRAGSCRRQPERVSPPAATAAAAPSLLDARERDPRPQARRGRARANRCAERVAPGMAPSGRALGAAQSPQAA